MSEVAQLELGSGDTGIAHDAPMPVKPLPQWAYPLKARYLVQAVAVEDRAYAKRRHLAQCKARR